MTIETDGQTTGIRDDLQFLAGHLPHRAANTDEEREAAQYIAKRFRQSIPNTHLDDFYTAEAPWLMFASYYGEFFIVSLLAVWWPRVALCYGGLVFLAHLAEVLGYRLLARFMPQFESQNVQAQMLSPNPKRLLVVTAHYDSPLSHPLTSSKAIPWLRLGVKAVVVCMLIVLVACALQALNIGSPEALMITRWTATGFLLCAAAAMLYSTTVGENTRGANNNASGVATLLQLAERLAASPLQHTDVHLVATGSNQCWMSGMRHLIETHKFDRATTYILNIDTVGAGTLAYTTAVGFLQMMPCSRTLTEAAHAASPDATPMRLPTVMSDTLIPLARGYKSMEITSTSRNEEEDLPADEQTIAQAADLAEGIMRKLDG